MKGTLGNSICVLLLCFIFGKEAAAQSYEKAEAFSFSFEKGCDSLSFAFGDNDTEKERLTQILADFRKELSVNEYHLLIIAHAGMINYREESVVNEMSFRAGQVRTFMKTVCGVPDGCTSYYIDRSGHFTGQVHVYLIPKSLPWFANQDIYYSKNKEFIQIRTALKKYGQVPYVDMFMRGYSGSYECLVYVIDDPLFNRLELEDYALAINRNKSSQSMMKSDNRPVMKYAAMKKKTSLLPSRKFRPEVKRSSVYMAVKTNLLPLSGLVSSYLIKGGGMDWQRGAVMPNLELECYFGGNWSVSLSGMYADFNYKEWKDNKWAVSGLTVTPRFWPLQKGQFRWLSVGVFGQYGDFDVRGQKISGKELYGKTGRYYSTGCAVGCLIPLGAGFAFEGEVQAGYRSVFNGEFYRYDGIDNKNYLEERFEEYGFLIGMKLNLLYRFGLCK